ncbi:MAG: DUF3794 domain-containing protein [Negativicutes bacterium]|nr:DUF3794 domain-containing protein [Negativicutes bacterium]
MQDQERYINKCVLGVTGPHPIVVNQIIGECETQKTLDIHLKVPRRKPAIEQIVDVFVKDVTITNVEIIPDKVIVRGCFEIKAIYVACLPSQPVHAVEAKRIRFTADVPIRGARRGMDADASVAVEYVDYECDHNCRAYWHKAWERYYSRLAGAYKAPKWKKQHQHDACDNEWQPHHQHKHHHCDEDCEPKHHHHEDWDDCDCEHHHHDDCECPPKKKPRKCCREFDVSVVLRVVAKVMAGREIMVYPHYPGLPAKPKG